MGRETDWTTEFLARLAMVLASVFVATAVFEVGLRVLDGRKSLWTWQNLVTKQFRESLDDLQGRFMADPVVGFVNRPSYRGYDRDGNRATPPVSGGAVQGPPLLVTGDSFVFGDEVRDAETLPARLQTLVGRRTINGGVSGYGLDQTVLHTEQLAAVSRPAAVVVSFIPDDLWRAEFLRLWGMNKPYFALTPPDLLVLKNVPVSTTPAAPDHFTFWHHAFGWSFLARALLEDVDQHDDWTSNNRRATPAGTGEELACPLMRRLKALGVPVLVVAEYPLFAWQRGDRHRAEQHRQGELVLACASAAGLATLDTFETVDKILRDRGLRTLHGLGHHNAEGNRVMAEKIAQEISGRRMLE